MLAVNAAAPPLARIRVVVELCLEVREVRRQDPCVREETVLLLEAPGGAMALVTDHLDLKALRADAFPFETIQFPS